MKIITNSRKIQAVIEKFGIDKNFQTKDLEFLLVQYKKGEIIFQTSLETQYLLFVLEGKVKIFDISSEGDYVPRALAAAGNILGDLEFFDVPGPRLFCQAYTNVECLALSKSKYQKLLYQDVTFLHFLLKSFGEKINLLSNRSLPHISIEDLLILYLQNEPNHSFQGVNEMTVKFGCSRRQLQRVLEQLCEAGRIKRTGRGSYMLIE